MAADGCARCSCSTSVTASACNSLAGTHLQDEAEVVGRDHVLEHLQRGVADGAVVLLLRQVQPHEVGARLELRRCRAGTASSATGPIAIGQLRQVSCSLQIMSGDDNTE